MNDQEFQKRMTALLPDALPDAINVLMTYAGSLGFDGTHPAHQFYDEAYVEFSLVKQNYGQSIASDLLNLTITQDFSLNPFEIRGAARDCDRSLEEWQQSDAARQR